MPKIAKAKIWLLRTLGIKASKRRKVLGLSNRPLLYKILTLSTGENMVISLLIFDFF
jgi:hypothetical protein